MEMDRIEDLQDINTRILFLSRALPTAPKEFREAILDRIIDLTQTALEIEKSIIINLETDSCTSPT